MIITNHNVAFTTSHSKQQSSLEQETLQVHQVGTDGSGQVLQQASSDNTSLSDEALALAKKVGANNGGVRLEHSESELASRSNQLNAQVSIAPLSDRGDQGPVLTTGLVPLPAADAAAAGVNTGTIGQPSSLDPQMRLAAQIISAMTGKSIELTDVRDLEFAYSENAVPADGAPAVGMRYEHISEYHESELTTFSAQAQIHTADGRQIDVDLMMQMSRSYSSSERTLITAGAQLKDPLVINFDAPAVELSNDKFLFDIDADGNKDNINQVGSGSGLLMLDKNGDGRANNGSELFGALSGDGFADLAKYDDDGNGFIDEGDAIFHELKIWVKTNRGGDEYFSLADKGVGAIYLGSVQTPFELKNADNELQGQVRNSGFFIGEDGEAGTVQQIDLVV